MTTGQQPTHRADIQGLRAVLMIQVLLFHAWFVGSPIGVDAFIMISAYLMTGSFIRRSEAGSMPAVLDRWATTFKRLLPPLAVVVILSLYGSILILPATRWQGMVDQSFASLTYWQNWLLEWISADYFAQDHALASPLQHLWSMSMQGQIFLLWPALMALMVLVARKTNLSVRYTILFAFAAVTALSLYWLLTTSQPLDTSYFDTRARVWEFALGSAVAAAAPLLRVPARARRAVASLAFAVLVLFCLVSIGTYPGVAAAFPLLATSALLLFSRDGEGTVGRVLAWRPLTLLGDMSYAVYLVHWPIFVLYLVAVGKERLAIWDGLLLIAISIALSHLLTKYVDNPVRYLPWADTTWKKTQIVLLTLWVALTIVFSIQNGLWQTSAAQQRELEQVEFSTPPNFAGEPPSYPASPTENTAEDEVEELPLLEGFPGAAAMIYPGEVLFEGAPIPGPLTLEDEWVSYDGRCPDHARALLHQHKETGCHAHGDPSSPRIFIGGSSHAEQVLMPAARLMADQQGLYVEAALKAGCPWSMPDPNTSADCQGHNANVLQYIQENQFDYVFLIVTATTANSPDEQLGYDVVELIEQITATGAKVICVRDNLRSLTNLYECASAQEPNEPYGGCLLNRGDHYAPDSLLDPLENIPGFSYVDIMDLYCDGDICPTIAGNVHVYLDTNHVTESYGNTMAPILVDRFAKALDSLD